MGNQNCLCCQREGPGALNKDETNLSANGKQNQILTPIQVVDQSAFNDLFEKKLPEFGEYSTINDLNGHVSSIIKDSINESPYDVSKYSTNSKVYNAKPVQFKNGNIYAGNWNENVEMEGYGKLYLKKDNILAEGVWKGGMMTNGRIYFPNGDIYEGNIENSTFEGKGTLYFADGVVYKGDFKAGERSGEGVQTYPDGSIYTGQFEYDKFNNKGDFKWSNGYRYIGNFENSQLYGKGILSNEKTHSIYNGEFKKNTFHGNGTYTWGSTETSYEGQYENGIKQGKGIIKKANGFMFNGGFIDNRPHGYGEVNIGSKRYKCIWRNGETVETPQICNNPTFDGENYNSEKNKIFVDLNFEVEVEDMDPKNLKYLFNPQPLPRKTKEKQNGGSSFRPIEHITE